MVRAAVVVITLLAPSLAWAQADYVDPYSDVINAAATQLSIPELTTRRVVTAGEAIIDQRSVRLVEGAVIDTTFSSPPSISNPFSFSAGHQFYPISSKARFKVCSINMLGNTYSPCFLDDDGDGRFDRVATAALAKAQPISPLSYHRASIILPAAADRFSRTVLYQGAAGGALQLSYREFRNDLARPAFEENLSIPLAPTFPQQVAVKGAVLTIFKLDGLGIEYHVDRQGSFFGAPPSANGTPAAQNDAR